VLASIATSITEHLRHFPALAVYAVVTALVFSESALFVGFILPGETSVLVGSAVASVGHVNIVLLCTLVVAAAILGYLGGYLVGERFGHRMIEWPILQRRRPAIERSLHSLEQRGMIYVILGRFTAFLRAVMPALAGMSEMSRRRFMIANVSSGIVWGVAYCMLGYYAGQGLSSIENDSAWAGAGVLGAVIIAVVATHVVRRHRHREVEAT
jgi:membrane protein DedA with SNARE-associated domain